MPFLSNAHTHSTWCDGKNTIPEMLEAARRLGFVSLGFSGHAAQGFDFTYPMTMEEQHAYYAQLRALQHKGGPVRIWVGLEVETLSRGPELADAKANTDYIIGSLHYLLGQTPEVYAAVDGDPAKLKRLVEDAYHGDGLAAAKSYFETQTDLLLRIRPDIIGHFDLIRKYAGSIGLFDENDPAYQKIAREALARAFPCGGVLELNTGGIARGYLPTPYPTLDLLCLWRELGGRVTITSDCHNADWLDCAFNQAEALLKQAGYRSVMRLGTQDALWDEVEL